MPTRTGGSSANQSLRSDVNQYGASGSQSAERASQGGYVVTSDYVSRAFRLRDNVPTGTSGERYVGKQARKIATDLLNEAYVERSKYAKDLERDKAPDSPYAMDALDALQKMGEKWVSQEDNPSGRESVAYMDIIKRTVEALDYETKRELNDLARDAGL
jgi:hypothetical protein